MSVAERERFLSVPRLGIMSVAGPGIRATAGMPIWYAYEPGGRLRFIADRDLAGVGDRITLRALGDRPPYRYVTAEGPVTAIEDPVTARDRTLMAYRYLGPDLAKRYLEGATGEGLVLVRVRPEHWSTADF